MENTTFLDFYRTVTDHNMMVQKQLEKEHVLVISQLKEYVKEFPLADIYLHYPKDNETKDLLFCFSVHRDGPTQLLPVMSVYASADKIILSYLPQSQLDKFDFSCELSSQDNYMSSLRVVKYLYNETWTFSPQDSSMIFIEHIGDSLQWTSQHSEYKMYQAFSLIMITNFMLWDAYYFTPHY